MLLLPLSVLCCYVADAVETIDPPPSSFVCAGLHGKRNCDSNNGLGKWKSNQKGGSGRLTSKYILCSYFCCAVAMALVLCWCFWRYAGATGAKQSCWYANLQSYKPRLLLCCCCLCCNRELLVCRCHGSGAMLKLLALCCCYWSYAELFVFKPTIL